MVLVLSLLLFGGVAGADSLVCTARGAHALRYETWAKSGGAGPGPSTLMFQETWKLGERELYHHERPYQDPPRARGDLEWTWHEDRTRKTRLLRDGQVREVRYTTEVTVKTRSGRPLGEGQPAELRVVMDCHRTELFGVP